MTLTRITCPTSLVTLLSSSSASSLRLLMKIWSMTRTQARYLLPNALLSSVCAPLAVIAATTTMASTLPKWRSTSRPMLSTRRSSKRSGAKSVMKTVKMRTRTRTKTRMMQMRMEAANSTTMLMGMLMATMIAHVRPPATRLRTWRRMVTLMLLNSLSVSKLMRMKTMVQRSTLARTAVVVRRLRLVSSLMRTACSWTMIRVLNRTCKMVMVAT
mmetsp:Transcript_52804/g.158063  ORF Transcript_52804/g.158063 Transcript_52804/m.158063 type:complete len:214 (-) Transcript_52804:720-1361(-)